MILCYCRGEINVILLSLYITLYIRYKPNEIENLCCSEIRGLAYLVLALTLTFWQLKNITTLNVRLPCFVCNFTSIE